MQTAFLIAFLSELLMSACHLPSLSHPRDLDQEDSCCIEVQLFYRESCDSLQHTASTLACLFTSLLNENPPACAGDVADLQVKSQI